MEPDEALTSQGSDSVHGSGCNLCQKGGVGLSIETEDRVLALLQEVRQERHSMDAFLDPGNPSACFCCTLYYILEDIGGDQLKHCMDSM